ncbi:hypothetical protein Tco_1227183 [Tanacetum coccineum]
MIVIQHTFSTSNTDKVNIRASGHFTTSEDGTLTYNEGEANAENVTSETPFTDLNLRLVEIYDLNRSLLIYESVLQYLQGYNTLQPLFTIAHGSYSVGSSNTPAVGKTVRSVAATVATLTATTAATSTSRKKLRSVLRSVRNYVVLINL